MLVVAPNSQDLFDVQQALYVFAGHRGPFGQFALNVVRAGLKGVMTMMLSEELSRRLQINDDASVGA